MRQWRLDQKGRPRRKTMGGDHQRPLNRQEVRRDGFDSTITTGLGHNASTAAAMATASSSVGVGVISEVTKAS
jgi:hypothetical protein